MNDEVVKRLRAKIDVLEAKVAAYEREGRRKVVKITCDNKWGWIAWPVDAEIERDDDGIWFDVNCQHRGDRSLFSAIVACDYEDAGVCLPGTEVGPMLIAVMEVKDGVVHRS
jgi:hypothetical protein